MFTLHLKISYCTNTTQILDIWMHFSTHFKHMLLLQEHISSEIHHPLLISAYALTHISSKFLKPPLNHTRFPFSALRKDLHIRPILVNTSKIHYEFKLYFFQLSYVKPSILLTQIHKSNLWEIPYFWLTMLTSAKIRDTWDIKEEEVPNHRIPSRILRL